MSSQRYKLTAAYRGTHYHGWQQQPAVDTWKGDPPPPGEGIPTLQQTLSRAIAHVVSHPVTVVGSSRTDAGVHAKGQVAHFDSAQSNIPTEGLRRAVNHRLPDDVLVRAIEPVPPGFDAISSTAAKRYQYAIWNAPDREPFAADLAWHRWQRLDIRAMVDAANAFVGVHDFASFARPGHGRENTVRALTECSLSSRGPRLVIGIAGAGFLWNQIRIMVGTLVEVGLGRFTPADIPKMLKARDRQSAGPTAPPQGLYLQWIKFKPIPAAIDEVALASTQSHQSLTAPSPDADA